MANAERKLLADLDVKVLAKVVLQPLIEGLSARKDERDINGAELFST